MGFEIKRPHNVPTHANHKHNCGHSHHHHQTSQNMALAFFINLFFTLVEIAGAYWTGSVAIWADALHDLGDSVSLAVSWYFEKLAQKNPTQRFSYGMRRVSLVGALFSGAVVLSGGLIVLYHSLDFLWGQNGNSSLHTEGMALLAIFGVAANFIGAWRLSKGSTQNSKILTWHLIEDTLGWTAVLVGAIVIHFTQWYWLDPVLAIAITIYVSINVLRLSLETIKLFLQSTPIGFNKEALISEIKKIEHVLGVHEVHAWSLDGASNILSLHINVSDQVRASEEVKIKAQIRQCAARFGRFHSTIEIEHGHQECPDSCE